MGRGPEIRADGMGRECHGLGARPGIASVCRNGIALRPTPKLRLRSHPGKQFPSIPYQQPIPSSDPSVKHTHTHTTIKTNSETNPHRRHRNSPKEPAPPSTPRTRTWAATPSAATKRAASPRMIRPPRRTCRRRATWAIRASIRLMCAMSLRFNDFFLLF